MKKIYTSIKTVVLIIAVTCSITALAQAPVKKVLLEEFTTGSCGNCPPVSYNVNQWHEAHASQSIMVAIHEGSGVDSMSSTTTSAIFNAMHPSGGWFAPAIMINRAVYPSSNGEVYMTASDFSASANPDRDTIAVRVMNEPAKVGINISGTYNPSNRLISATVNVNFVQAVASGDWRINLFLVEDSVVGTPNLGAFAYDQHCYNSSWANSHYAGMYSGGSIIGYPHRHVMRKAMLGNWGAASIIPAVPVINTNYSTSATLTVPGNYNVSHLSLVAFVSSYGSTKTQKYVLNANQVKLSNTFATGIEMFTPANELSIDNLYPVPANGQTHLIYTLNKNDKTQITVTDMLGHIVKVLLPGKNTPVGTYEMLFDSNELAKGIYFVNLSTSENKVVKKLIVE